MGFLDIFFKKQNGKRSYQAAEYSRLVSDWIASFTTSDAEVRAALPVLRARGRDLGRNNPFARSVLRSHENNVIGSGIRMQSNARDKQGNPIIEFNKQVEKEWRIWCRQENCHVGGTLSFQDIERMVIRERAEAGEVFVLLINRKFGRSKVKLGLQILESDMLDVNFNGEYRGNIVRMGIEVDEFNRPEAFHFFKNHPGDTSFNGRGGSQERVRVEAKYVRHLFIKERPTQSRGVTIFAAAIMSLRHLGGFIDATVVGKRVKASVMGFITQPEVETSENAIVQNGERVEDFAPGKFVHLDPGEKVEIPNLGGDSGNEFNPFVQAMLRNVASSTGTSYEEVSKDYSQANYSSSRLSLMSERDNYKVLQQWIIRDFHQPVFEVWLEIAVMSGVIKTPNDFYINQENYNQPKWLARGWDWVDPQKDINADKEALKAGLKTLSDCLADEGKDFEETFEQIKKERELLKKHGIELDIFNEIGGKGEKNNKVDA